MGSFPPFNLLSILGLILLATTTDAHSYSGADYYKDSCPQATTIVTDMVNNFVKANKNLAGGFLRLHFHDCFVRGCDASVLLNSPTNSAEKDARPNAGSLRGFHEIDQIKAALEAECPGIVSCGDILALAARDATVKVGGQSWSLDLGRKDGKVSISSEADAQLPSPFATYDQLVQNFSAVGFTQEEMVILSGGHTIGRSSCGAVQPRLYNFNGVAGLTDPSIDPSLAKELKKKCPENEPGTTLAMDSTKNTFDHLYFKAVLNNKGLFQSDANLLTNPVGKELVTRYSKAGSSFSSDFAGAMTKMSNIQWATDGEVRRVCSIINQ
ncbi:hypothetical protein MARPO_0106s0054 [Marchantia polymorpha]|uniref:Peroxidase n=1 Tax=Marchantia polymorpha TaxID=3197 RepID=A0A2R6WDD8_MARPO|nr:hypothetical protein MARPO_0106s0054 [Marchantia polymorpha]|eukprot:PTQ31869.1 hypothetical protein MARPO_0106s0054 [Marchantia polymorpha]